MKERFFICRRCGNLAGLIHDGGRSMKCCGEEMEALTPNTAEAANEKHLPKVKIENDKLYVNVGEINHPMLDEHSIVWVYVQTEFGGMRKSLKPGGSPEACFCLCGEKPVAVYAYCNLHGLWMTEIK